MVDACSRAGRRGGTPRRACQRRRRQRGRAAAGVGADAAAAAHGAGGGRAQRGGAGGRRLPLTRLQQRPGAPCSAIATNLLTHEAAPAPERVGLLTRPPSRMPSEPDFNTLTTSTHPIHAVHARLNHLPYTEYYMSRLTHATPGIRCASKSLLLPVTPATELGPVLLTFYGAGQGGQGRHPRLLDGCQGSGSWLACCQLLSRHQAGGTAGGGGG